MAESLTDFLRGEFQYLHAREGREFFLALGPYANARYGNEHIRRILRRLERDTTKALKRYVDEENEFIAEAKRLRRELADRAPEVDNSDMERPDCASHARVRYYLDSFARFDELADADAKIGFGSLPRDDVDPGPVSTLLIILRGRLRAAVYGEDAPGNAVPRRDDLDDLSRRIGNLQERHTHALTGYPHGRADAPWPCLCPHRPFGLRLDPDPTIIETDEDFDHWLDQTLRELRTPKPIVRKLANGEQLDDWEETSVGETEQALKVELDRLTQELTSHVPASGVVRFLREPLVVAILGTIVGGVAVGLVLALGFRIGG